MDRKFQENGTQSAPACSVFELDQCSGGSTDVEIISPVESVAEQAKYRVKQEKKRKRSKRTSGVA
jgi:hypothetical protein